MPHTSPKALAAAFPLASLALTLFLATAGCVPPPPAPQAVAPAKSAQAAPQVAIAYVTTLKDKNSQNLTPAQYRKDKSFGPAYKAFLHDNNVKDRWARVFYGTSGPITRVRINGQEYLHITSCKPSSCAENNIDILYGEKSKALYALLTKDAATTWLGDPPPFIQQAQKLLRGIEPPQ